MPRRATVPGEMLQGYLFAILFGEVHEEVMTQGIVGWGFRAAQVDTVYGSQIIVPQPNGVAGKTIAQGAVQELYLANAAELKAA